MKKKVKELRVKIDGLAQLCKGLDYDGLHPYAMGGIITTHSDQVEDAIKSLYLAKAWLGKVLGALGTESPYPKDGMRHIVEDIEPTADTGQPYVNQSELNHIEKVDWLRQEIQKCACVIEPYPKDDGKSLMNDTEYMDGYSMFNAHRHLSEARFWLGFELERIRESK